MLKWYIENCPCSLQALTKSSRIKLELSGFLARKFGVFRHIFFLLPHLQILISDLNHSNGFRNTMEAEQN